MPIRTRVSESKRQSAVSCSIAGLAAPFRTFAGHLGARPTVRINRQTIALRLDLHADALRAHGRSVLDAATCKSIVEWTDADLDKALGAVAYAHHDLDRAVLLEDVADGLRFRDWEERGNRAA
jgi:hypothetical protein